METKTDTAINLNEVEFVIKPVQNFSGIDNNLLLIGLLTILLFIAFKNNKSLINK